MEESYIRDYMINLLENTYSDDLERLKAIYYALEYITMGKEYDVETDNEKKNLNTLTTCLLNVKEIIDEEDRKSSIPQF